MLNLEERFKYYLGNVCETNSTIGISADYNSPFQFTCGMRMSVKIRSELKNEFRFFVPYFSDMNAFCKNNNNIGDKFVVQFGDRPMKRAYGLSKSRRVPERCSILFPFNTARHWRFKYIPNETPWRLKKETIVWRGATTGRYIRMWYVNELHKAYDIKFSMVVQKKSKWITPDKMGKGLTQRQLLRYKYILSLPGNDVATSLKWLMMQNSVVVMPPPRVEGWLMEGLLEPYVHYVPIYHPHNMSSVIDWMRNHDEECRTIVKNANAWIKAVLEFQPVLSMVLEYSKNKLWNQTITQLHQTRSVEHFD